VAKRGGAVVSPVASTRDEINPSSKEIADIIGEITAPAPAQSDGIGQVSGAATELERMTQQNAALVGQAAAAASSLEDRATRPAEVVGHHAPRAHAGALSRARRGTARHGRMVAMSSAIVALALVVADYDEAIAWYSRALGFTLLEDRPMGGGKRWVRMAPPGGEGCALLLAKAVNDEQASRVGNQTGGRVFLFLHTTDFDAEVARLQAAGARFTESPRNEAYGRVVVFLDLYGNKWDLIQPA